MEKITYIEYLNLSPEEQADYNEIAPFINVDNTFGEVTIEQFRKMDYGDIVDLKRNFRKGTVGDMVNSICLVFKTEEADVLKTEVFKIFALLNFITEQIKIILQMEARELSYTPSNKEIRAGIEELGRFSDLTTIDSLAGGNILNWEKVIKMPYDEVFAKLAMDSTRARIQKKLETIK